jgi:ubiquinone/menaquinone biosynthesis C-methylase UbiE
MSNKLENEIIHGRYLAQAGAGEVWNWESPAGRERWKRRVGILTSGIRPGMNILELGCGTGYFTKELTGFGANITAIDVSPELLEIAEKTVTTPSVTFLIENAFQMTFTDASFDMVIGSSVLHHLDVERAIPEIYRVLKPGGSITFTEPNMMNPQIAAERNIPYFRRKLGNSPDETAFFRWSLKKKLVTAGFSNVYIHPFDFLHPAVPQKKIPLISKIGNVLERTFLVKEIAGSLIINAEKKINSKNLVDWSY